MICTSPLVVATGELKRTYNGKISQGLRVPCGKCIACRILRTAEWTERLMNEYETLGRKGYFLTLTYNEECYPEDGKLKREHLKNFIRRLERKVDKLSYYGVGEYGSKTLRAHYHLIVMGFKLPEKGWKKYGKYWTHDFISRLWKFGNNTVGSFDRKSCQYVTGYIRKKQIGKNSSDDTFSIMTKNIGRKYFEKNFDRIFKALTESGSEKIVPRYYKKLIKKYSPERYKLIIEKLEELQNKKINIYGDEDIHDDEMFKDMRRRKADNDWKEKNKNRGYL